MAYDDSEYLEMRAETEIEMARRATDSRAVQAHYQLANFYLERLHAEPEKEKEPEKETA